MILEEFNQLWLATDKRVKEEYKEAKAKWEKNDFSFNDKFKTSKYVYSDCIKGYTSQEVIAVIKEYEKEVTETKGEIVQKVHSYQLENEVLQVEFTGDEEYGEVDTVYFSTEFNIFREVEDITESYSKYVFREIITNKLKPESESYASTVDCKLLQLFKDATIDWKTLQKLTYKDCEL